MMALVGFIDGGLATIGLIVVSALAQEWLEDRKWKKRR